MRYDKWGGGNSAKFAYSLNDKVKNSHLESQNSQNLINSCYTEAEVSQNLNRDSSLSAKAQNDKGDENSHPRRHCEHLQNAKQSTLFCHSEGGDSRPKNLKEMQNRDISTFLKPQYDKFNKDFSPSLTKTCNDEIGVNSQNAEFTHPMGCEALAEAKTPSAQQVALNATNSIQQGIFKPKFYFIIGIIFNLCLLGFFKYTDFFLENFNTFARLANLDFEIPLPHILLPLALSFVSFQQIAFLYDCYKCTKGELSENLNVNFIDYALFISFFPQLIAGPIVHHREMIPQFAKIDSHLGNHSADLGVCDKARTSSPLTLPQTPKNYESTTATARIVSLDSKGESKNSQNSVNSLPNSAQNSTNLSENSRSIINYEFLAKGIFIFSIGLFKKAFIADTFAKWANAGFATVERGEFLNIFESWATSLSYTFQLYYDFSGYCDMAMGLGLMFGIVLPLNFNSPYKALNIAEFWRRWHITLGRFLKECVYIPLGGKRFGKFLTLRNLFIVAFLSGVWHGAGWGFVIWGVLHGVAMLIHRIYSWWVESIKSPSLAEGDLGGGSVKSTQNSTNSLNLSENLPLCHTEALAEVSQNPNNRDISLSLNMTKNNDGNFSTKFLNFTQTKAYTFLCWLLTFNFINLAWVFFRAENLSAAFNLLKSMFGIVWVELPQKWHRMPETLAHISGRNDTIFYILIAILLCVFAKNSAQITQNFRSNALKFTLFLRFNLRFFGKRAFCLKGGGVFVRFLVSIGLFWASVWILLTSLLASNAYSPFIYFNF